MSKLFDANENLINLNNPTTQSEETDDTNRLRSVRMMNINNELKKAEKSESESFFNYIERENLDLEKDKEKIISGEQFINYYFINNFSTTYIELCEGDLELTDPVILSMVILFDKLYHSHKWKIKQISNYFIMKNMEMKSQNDEYAKILNDEFNKFYDKNILKREKGIN